MDFVTFASQNFLEACESLVVAYELNNNVETQVVVDKVAITCGLFSNVVGYFHPMHDEEFAEKKIILVQILKEWSAKMFITNCLGF